MLVNKTLATPYMKQTSGSDRPTTQHTYPEPLPIWTDAIPVWKWTWPLHVYGFGSLNLIAMLITIGLSIRLYKRLLVQPITGLVIIVIIMMCLCRSIVMFLDAYHSTSVLPVALTHLLTGLPYPCLIASNTLTERMLSKIIKPTSGFNSCSWKIVCVSIFLYFGLNGVVYSTVSYKIITKHWLVLTNMIFITWGFAISFLLAYKCYRLSRHCRKSRRAREQIIAYSKLKNNHNDINCERESLGGKTRMRIPRMRPDLEEGWPGIISVVDASSSDSESQKPRTSAERYSNGLRKYARYNHGQLEDQGNPDLPPEDPFNGNIYQNAAGILTPNKSFCIGANYSDYEDYIMYNRQHAGVEDLRENSNEIVEKETEIDEDNNRSPRNGYNICYIRSSTDCLNDTDAVNGHVSFDHNQSNPNPRRVLSKTRKKHSTPSAKFSISSFKSLALKRVRHKNGRKGTREGSVTHLNSAFIDDSDVENDCDQISSIKSAQDMKPEETSDLESNITLKSVITNTCTCSTIPFPNDNTVLKCTCIEEPNDECEEKDSNQQQENNADNNLQPQTISICREESYKHCRPGPCTRTWDLNKTSSIDTGSPQLIKEKESDIEIEIEEGWEGREVGYLADTELSSPPCFGLSAKTTGRITARGNAVRDTGGSPRNYPYPLPVGDNGVGLRRILHGCSTTRALPAAYLNSSGSFLICAVQIYSLFGVYGVLSNHTAAKPWQWLLYQTVARLSEVIYVYTLLWICHVISQPARPHRSSHSRQKSTNQHQKTLSTNLFTRT